MANAPTKSPLFLCTLLLYSSNASGWCDGGEGSHCWGNDHLTWNDNGKPVRHGRYLNQVPAASENAASQASTPSMTPIVTPANAQQSDTLTLVVHANKAAKAYTDQQWAKAKNEFRICIGEKQSVEFYEGLYNTCMKSGEWDQVAYALEKIFAIDPSQKIAHSYEYGQALFYLNRYDEAIPYLKSALTAVDDPVPVYTPKVKNVPVLASPIVSTGCRFDNLPLAYVNAATHSESICLAEYAGYDRSGDIDWDHPPQAHYQITEILKGPSYDDAAHRFTKGVDQVHHLHGRALPVKYEFHDLVNPTMPNGWKFSEKLMPEKDSKWILFIEFAVPKRGMFELYQGSFGRLPAIEENLNQVKALLDKYNLLNRHD